MKVNIVTLLVFFIKELSTNNRNHNYNRRHRQKLLILFRKLTSTQHSLSHRALMVWNDLPNGVKLYRFPNIELKNTSCHYMTYNSYFTDTITSYMCMFTILLNLHSYDDNFSYLYPISPLHLACIFIAMSVSFMACVSVDLCVRNFYIL